MTEKDLLLGVDVGGTKIRIGSVDRSYQLSSPCSVYRSYSLETGDPCEALAGLLRMYMSENSIQPDRVRMISIGLPGSIRNDFQTVFQLPNCAGGKLDGVNVGQQLGALLDIPVLINKDVNNLLYNDIEQKQLKGVTAGVYIGTGIGTAVNINGRLLYGSQGFAMDCGHLHLTDREGLCGCGNHGCAEGECSGLVLLKLKNRFFPETEMENLFTEHADTEILRKYVADCSEVPAILATVFDPDTMILGGGVLGMKDFPMDALIREIRKRTERAVAAGGIRFCSASAGPESGVIGAAVFADRYTEEKGKNERTW